MAKAIYELPVTRDDVVVLQLALETFSNKCHYLANEDEDINEDEKATCEHILEVVSSMQFKLNLILKMLQFNANTEHEEGEE